jgi:dCTP deaminase
VILTGPEIRRLCNVDAPAIPRLRIWPWDNRSVGPNSYDVHLGDTILVYADTILSVDRSPKTKPVTIHTNGCWLLQPGRLYLGHTVEDTECHGLVPYLDGRSSIGRLGISVHVTAGRGDDGFRGQWTLEITAVQPVWIRPGIRIGQLTFHELTGERQPYQGRYQGQGGPTASRFSE